jgi:hypothetical protein
MQQPISQPSATGPSEAKTHSASLPIAPSPPSSVVATTTITSTPDAPTTFKTVSSDTIANGFSTLIGALIGAMLAYTLQRRLHKSQENKQSLLSAHRLMFALLQQLNTIILIQRDYVYSELKNPAKYLSIPATPAFDKEKNILELPELTFLLENQEGRAILYEFYIAQENYIEAINQWNLRSMTHLEKVQPALAASKIVSTGLCTEVDIKNALGDHTFGLILNSTQNCIESLQRAFKKLSAVKVKVRKHLVKTFKTENFTDFDFPNTYGLDEMKK